MGRAAPRTLPTLGAADAGQHPHRKGFDDELQNLASTVASYASTTAEKALSAQSLQAFSACAADPRLAHRTASAGCSASASAATLPASSSPPRLGARPNTAASTTRLRLQTVGERQRGLRKLGLVDRPQTANAAGAATEIRAAPQDEAVEDERTWFAGTLAPLRVGGPYGPFRTNVLHNAIVTKVDLLRSSLAQRSNFEEHVGALQERKRERARTGGSLDAETLARLREDRARRLELARQGARRASNVEPSPSAIAAAVSAASAAAGESLDPSALVEGSRLHMSRSARATMRAVSEALLLANAGRVEHSLLLANWALALTHATFARALGDRVRAARHAAAIEASTLRIKRALRRYVFVSRWNELSRRIHVIRRTLRWVRLRVNILRKRRAVRILVLLLRSSRVVFSFRVHMALFAKRVRQLQAWWRSREARDRARREAMLVQLVHFERLVLHKAGAEGGGGAGALPQSGAGSRRLSNARAGAEGSSPTHMPQMQQRTRLDMYGPSGIASPVVRTQPRRRPSEAGRGSLLAPRDAAVRASGSAAAAAASGGRPPVAAPVVAAAQEVGARRISGGGRPPPAPRPGGPFASSGASTTQLLAARLRFAGGMAPLWAKEEAVSAELHKRLARLPMLRELRAADVQACAGLAGLRAPALALRAALGRARAGGGVGGGAGAARAAVASFDHEGALGHRAQAAPVPLPTPAPLPSSPAPALTAAERRASLGGRAAVVQAIERASATAIQRFGRGMSTRVTLRQYKHAARRARQAQMRLLLQLPPSQLARLRALVLPSSEAERARRARRALSSFHLGSIAHLRALGQAARAGARAPARGGLNGGPEADTASERSFKRKIKAQHARFRASEQPLEANAALIQRNVRGRADRLRMQLVDATFRAPPPTRLSLVITPPQAVRMLHMALKILQRKDRKRAELPALGTHMP